MCDDDGANKYIKYQEQLSDYWASKMKDMEASIKVERQWAQFVRIKYDALREVGFTEDQAMKVVVAQYSIR
jgi:hypothetical protein